MAGQFPKEGWSDLSDKMESAHGMILQWFASGGHVIETRPFLLTIEGSQYSKHIPNKVPLHLVNPGELLAEKPARPGYSRVAAFHQNTRGLPSCEGYKALAQEHFDL